MKSRAAELLSRPETILALERFASEYPAVVCIPGEKAELHDSAGPDRQPRTALRRQPDGSILAEGTGRTDYQLPEPGQKESRHRNKHPHGWSSANAATLLRTAALQTLPPFRKLDTGAIAADRRFDQAFPYAYLPETIDRQWLTAVQSMLNPETWRICRQAAPDPQNERTGLTRYNRAARSAAALAQTIETNPGAAAWFMAIPRPEPEPAPNHPGQIIAIVRDEFRRAGGRSWKTMAAMDPAEAAIFAEPGNETGFARHNPQHPLAVPARRLAAYANMRYEAGGPPPPDALRQDVADALSDAARTVCHRPGQALSRLAEELDSAGNLIQCLTLFINESRRDGAPPEAELRRQTFQVADYLLDAGGRRPITARNWRGLLKKRRPLAPPHYRGEQRAPTPQVPTAQQRPLPQLEVGAARLKPPGRIHRRTGRRRRNPRRTGPNHEQLRRLRRRKMPDPQHQNLPGTPRKRPPGPRNNLRTVSRSQRRMAGGANRRRQQPRPHRQGIRSLPGTGRQIRAGPTQHGPKAPRPKRRESPGSRRPGLLEIPGTGKERRT